MDWGDVPTWVSSISAVVSIGGAAFAWWRSNLSRRAKEEAEAARLRADEALAATKAQAEAARESAGATRAIADALAPPVLVAQQAGNDIWLLRNTSREPVTIAEWLNQDTEAIVQGLETLPVTIPPGQSHEVLALATWGGSIHELVLRLDGHPQPVVVPIPDR